MQVPSFKWEPFHRVPINYHIGSFPPYKKDTENKVEESEEDARLRYFLKLHNLEHLFNVLKSKNITDGNLHKTSDELIDSLDISANDKNVFKMAVGELKKSNELAMTSIQSIFN